MLRSIIKKAIVLVLGVIVFNSCQPPKKEIIFPVSDLTKENMIPYPLKVSATNSAFALDKNSIIQTSKTDKSFTDLGHFLSKKIKAKLNLNREIGNDTFEQTKDQIAENYKQATLKSLHQLIPPSKHDNDIYTDTLSVTNLKLLGSKDAVTIFRARKNTRPIAAILTAIAPDGYTGKIKAAKDLKIFNLGD